MPRRDAARKAPLGASIMIAAACLLACASPASAQKDSAVVLGGSVSISASNDKTVQTPLGFSVVLRLRHLSGPGGTIGFNWLNAPLKSEGENGQAIGRLLVRPIMVGPAYTRQYARFALTGSFVAGYAFNGLRRITGPANYRVSNSFACRPSVSIWWELGNRWGFLSSLSYLVTRPELTTTTAAGSTRRTLNLNAPSVTFGIGYGVF